MTSLAIYVRLESKPGKEQEVADLLKQARALVMDEPATTAWFAVRLGPSTFAIFDAFDDEQGRQAHIQGRVAAALIAESAGSVRQLDRDRQTRRGRRQAAALTPEARPARMRDRAGLAAGFLRS